MYDDDRTDAERFEDAIQRSVQQILRNPEPTQYLDWATRHLPELLGLSDVELDEIEQRRLVTLLGTAIWNATPQPSRAFQIDPMPPHPAEAPCVCGSGLRHRDCCGAIEDRPRLSTDLVWEILLRVLADAQIEAALEVRAVPPALFCRVAERWLDEDRPRRALALLEPLFSDPLDRLGGELEPALDILCDVYDRLDYRRKKRAFLDRVCAEAGPTLRAAAWQRRCTMSIDAGDFSTAHAAFTEALRSEPGNPGTAILEITLLAAQHKDWIARERARFWTHRLRRDGFEHLGVLEFLARAMDDPQEALADSHADVLDPQLLDLQDWLGPIQDRPAPSYRLERRGAGAERAPQPSFQLPLFDEPERALRIVDRDAAADARPRASSRPVVLRPPASLRRLESNWRGLFTATKPDATRLIPAGASNPWAQREWLAYLLEEPALADSIEVLDDLATALYVHPSTALPWISHLLLRPVLERAWTIVLHSLPPDSPHQIPWSVPRNRPALRLLFRRYLCLVEEGEPEAAATTLETLLRLNPRDNHGVRAELMNHYLREGEDELALALAHRFPNDGLADLAYGEVLALYRLGRQERARSVLSKAVHRLPRIPQYLTRKRIKRPRLTPAGIAPSGEDQAWLYREAMRDVWEAEPGILAWLRRLTA